jgi:hypothetical protein
MNLGLGNAAIDILGHDTLAKGRILAKNHLSGTRVNQELMEPLNHSVLSTGLGRLTQAATKPPSNAGVVTKTRGR